MKSCLLLLWGLLAPLRAGADTYQVSPAPLPDVAADHQFRTIRDAARLAQAGDTVRIHTGVYRESVTVTADGTAARPITFEAAPGANVVVTGADRLTGWQREPGPDNVYSVAWPYSFIGGPTHAHPDDDYHLLIGRAEQVFAGGYLLTQTLRRGQLGRGCFFADLEAKRLYVWRADDGAVAPDDPTIEASTRSVLWQCKGDFVTVRGIRFRYAANAAQQGAAQFAGRGDRAWECVFERTNGSGAAFTAPDQVVRDCVFRDNGQLGFGADGADRLRLTGCTIENNNVKDFSRGWEAGGEKTVLSRGVVFDHCRVRDNRGVGLWFDIGNEDCEVENCLITDNEDAGIFYEISYGLHAHDNVIVGNGLAETPGGWGSQAGICLSSSPGCLVERNLLVANREGFDFREQGRTTWRIGFKSGVDHEVAVWNHDETVRHNVLADNRDAQAWGWFDVTDERHWPRALQEKTPDTRRAAPPGLSLEQLHLTLADNLYSAPDGQGLFHWGTDWRRHVYYTDLTTVRRQLGLEQGSALAPLTFGDILGYDFRVPAGSPALKTGDYPQGTVPDVQLGLLPATPSEARN